MRVAVDFDRCQGNAICMSACPEVFAVRDNGLLYLLDEHPDESLRLRVSEAERQCPTQAIRIED